MIEDSSSDEDDEFRDRVFEPARTQTNSSPSHSFTVDGFSISSSDHHSDEPVANGLSDLTLSNTTKSYTSTDLSKPTGKEKTENGVNRTESATLSGNQHDPQEYQTILQAPDNEEEQREIAKKRIQLYVFCLRAIAYPFNAKQPTDLVRRQCKITPQQLEVIRERFHSFLAGHSNIVADEAFFNAMQSYYEVFMQSPRINRMVESGGATATDFRQVFKTNVQKRIRLLPEIDGMGKDNLIHSWLTKFDAIYFGEDESAVDGKRKRAKETAQSELILTKEQLYDMFQYILGIQRYEHQQLAQGCQLENGDEQAAAIRRELDGRRQFCDKVMRDRLFPKFLVPDGKSQLEWNKIYVEEQRQAVNVLMQNLESMPVTKRLENSNYGARALQNMSGVVKPLSRIDKVSDADDSSLTKSDISLMFTIELVVQEVTNIKNADAKRKVYCTMEMEGGEKMATNAVPSTAAKWDCQADFRSNQIRPCLKVKLFQKSKNMLAIEDKELGRVLIKPLPNTPTCTEWYTMYTGQKNKSEADCARIRLGIRIDKPANLKHCGYLYAQGKQAWKKWKMRFFALVQVSQYTFAMCSFQERKTDPHEMVQLDGFTVDYSLPESGLEGGTVFFNAMKESDSIIFSCSDDEDRNLWVQAIYRATGQSYKPQIPSNNTPKLRPTSIEAISTANAAPVNNSSSSKTLPKHPYLEEFLQIDPTSCDQVQLFEDLLRETLRHRLNDQYACLGWLSPGQLFLMDEYCARYGVRGVIRQILYLNELLDHAEKGSMIDPTLLHFCYAYVSSHNYGNSPEGYQTVTVNEMAQFYSVRERLQSYLESQLANIRYSFPFGRPEGALKATLSLLERVLMNDLSTPVPMEEIKGIVTVNLDKAAKLNFAQVQQESRLEDYDVILSTPEKRLDELVHLAELCIEVHQQNEEYHSEGREAFPWFPEAMRDHNELFWFQFSVEMDLILEAQPSDCWDSFPLFQLLNDFFASSGHVLFKGRFHKHLMDVYAPMVIRYIDLMETSIAQAVYRGLENETWQPCQYGSQTTDDVLWKLDALQTFIFDLHWPEDVFATHLQSRLKVMANDMIHSIINNILEKMEVASRKLSTSSTMRLPISIIVMLNSVNDCQKRFLKLCGSTEAMVSSGMKGIDTDETMVDLENCQKNAVGSIIDSLMKVMDTTLNKLGRYDEGSLTKTFLSFTKPSMDTANGFIQFIRQNQDIIREKINDEDVVEEFFQDWHRAYLKALNEWLKTRAGSSLNIHQLKSLIKIFKKMTKDFELQGVLNVREEPYGNIANRLKVEEATASVTQGPLGEGVSMEDSDGERS